MVEDLLAYKDKIDSVVQFSFTGDAVFLNAEKVGMKWHEKGEKRCYPIPAHVLSAPTYASSRRHLRVLSTREITNLQRCWPNSSTPSCAPATRCERIYSFGAVYRYSVARFSGPFGATAHSPF